MGTWFCRVCGKWHRHAVMARREDTGQDEDMCVKQWQKRCPHEYPKTVQSGNSVFTYCPYCFKVLSRKRLR